MVITTLSRQAKLSSVKLALEHRIARLTAAGLLLASGCAAEPCGDGEVYTSPLYDYACEAVEECGPPPSDRDYCEFLGMEGPGGFGTCKRCEDSKCVELGPIVEVTCPG